MGSSHRQTGKSRCARKDGCGTYDGSMVYAELCGQGLAVVLGTKLAILKGGRSAEEHGGGGLGVGRVCTDLLWEET